MTTPKTTAPTEKYAKLVHAHPHTHDVSDKADLNHTHSEAIHYHSDLSDAIGRDNDRITSVRKELLQHADHADVVEVARALIRAFELGNTFNSAQVKALHTAKVLIGDAHGTGCDHEERVREKGDRLICQSCQMDVTGLFDN